MAAAVVLLICDASPGWADGELLELLWKREENGLTYERVCKQGKLVVMSNSDSELLIDLKDGSTIYNANPNTEHGIFTNYNGDKFYVLNTIENKWKEYDVKTKKFIRNTFGPDRNTNNSAHYVSSDSVYTEFNLINHSLLFKNLNSGLLLDSFKIPNTPNTPTYSASPSEWKFTNDGRYMTFALSSKDKPYSKTFYLYDRVKREIIFEKNVDPYYGYYRYAFFNKSNMMAYAEEIKLPGDDAVYSYIRIFDLDQRKMVKNIKLDKFYNDGFIINQEDNKIIYQLGDNMNPNIKKIYNLETEKSSDFTFRTNGVGLIMADSSIIYSYITGKLAAQKIDWSVGVNIIKTKEDTIIYPNPSNNNISVTIPELYYLGLWNISDLKGNIILQGNIQTQNILIIDLNSFIPQTYFLSLINNNNKVTYKIIKQ
jgi:hypothetical protein